MQEFIARLTKSSSGDVKIRVYDEPQYRNIITTQYYRYNGVRNSKDQRQIAKESIVKTKRTIYELVDNNIDQFQSFITLTFRDEIENFHVAVSYLKKYLKKVKYQMKKKNKQFMYICIPEIQMHRKKMTGKQVIHFHLLTNLPVGSFFIPKREHKPFYSTEKNKWVHSFYYDLTYWTYGYSHAEPLEDKNCKKIVGYLTEYLQKGLSDAFFSQRKLMHSLNLVRNTVVYLNDDVALGEALSNYNDYFIGEYIPTYRNHLIGRYTELEYRIPKQINNDKNEDKKGH